MRIDLHHSAAIVTGGAQGLGRGIALELARAGAAVLVADLHLEAAEIVADEVRAMGCKGAAVRLDVSDRASVEHCVAEAIQQFGRIDILVNNAGIFQNDLGLALRDADFNHCLDVNLTGMWRMTQALVPHLRAHGGGKIINVASVGGRLGIGFAPAYCASKAGVINLSQSLASLLGPDNINVNTVCPGVVSTAMQENIKALRARSGENAPVRPTALTGPVTPQDIGYAIVFFASDLARKITGQALNVDGGCLMN
jgi:NAD(P)-dependent dehydrogenase (short-subunit alcohol dehydrogenase family)